MPYVEEQTHSSSSILQRLRLRVGNCNMGAFNTLDGNETKKVDWMTPMLEDTNYCGPICPPDGCRA
eukprot:scaffold3337_cov204-Alexandrium_tamarense.AAC.14